MITKCKIYKPSWPLMVAWVMKYGLNMVMEAAQSWSAPCKRTRAPSFQAYVT